MDFSKLPPAQYIPGRQAAIDHAGAIEWKPFVISTAVLFATAVLSVLIRFAIRIFGRRRIHWDDFFVLLATMALVVAFGVLHRLLSALYLTEAVNKHVTIPFRQDIPEMLGLVKWSFIFAVMNWTSVYLVKASFLCFFHVLTWGLSKRVIRFYWATVGIMVFCWAYTVVNGIIICPHFGADAAKCGENPHQHIRSLSGNIIVAILDIVCDILIVAIPIVILKKSIMPFSQKVSIAIILCLSVVMIVCALVRLIGSVTETRKNFNGTAPVWATYWAFIEACISLIMASAIVIRGVFITNVIHNDRQKQESIFNRFGRRLLSTLRLSGSSRSSRRSPPRSGYQSTDDQPHDANAPRIATQDLPHSTISGIRTVISGGKNNKNHRDTVASVDTAYVMQDLDYHNILKNEGAKP